MRQALEIALEALLKTQNEGFNLPGSSIREAITAIKEALAQPEQEPVATLDDLEQEIYENTRQFVSRDVMEWMLKRYYTTPPQRKPLTDEQIAEMWLEILGSTPPSGIHEDGLQPWRFARAIEAAHCIKE